MLGNFLRAKESDRAQAAPAQIIVEHSWGAAIPVAENEPVIAAPRKATLVHDVVDVEPVALAAQQGGGVEIGDAADLPAFNRKMYDDPLIKMPPSMRHKVCPVEVQAPEEKDKKRGKFSLIVTKEMIGDDYLDEIVSHLQVKWDVAEPLYHVASGQVLIDLCRDKVMDHKKRKAGGAALVQKNTGALWAQFEQMVRFAMKNEVSDFHIEIDRRAPKSQVQFRIHGKLVAPADYLIDTGTLFDMVGYLFNNHSKNGSHNSFNENLPQQCQLTPNVDGRQLLFRWASDQSAIGSKVVMRMLYQDTLQDIKSLEELGYTPAQVVQWNNAISRHKGGISVAGIVGSGKSTTMQTNMTGLPKWMAKYSVEDPVEYLMPGVTQFNVSRSLTDVDGDPFIAVKRQMKRMDPSAVLIGEVRDYESSSMFRDICESGHLAFTTVHAPSAAGSIDRFCSTELGIPRAVMATPGFMNLLVYQALVPISCECRLEMPARKHLSAEYLNRMERLFEIDVDGIYLTNKAGCPKCRREGLDELNGIAARKVVAEMLELDTDMLEMVRDHRNIELVRYINSMRRAGFDDPDSLGKSAMEMAIYRVAQGEVSPLEVEAKFGKFEQYENEQKRIGLGIYRPRERVAMRRLTAHRVRRAV